MTDHISEIRAFVEDGDFYDKTEEKTARRHLKKLEKNVCCQENRIKFSSLGINSRPNTL